MGNQRYNRINAHETTFLAGSGITYDATAKNGSAHVGKAVKRSAAGTVVLTTVGSEVFGRLQKVEPDGYCAVQDEGYCDLPIDTGETIVYTDGLVGGTVAGTVKSGTNNAVLAIDSGGTGLVMAKFC